MNIVSLNKYIMSIKIQYAYIHFFMKIYRWI